MEVEFAIIGAGVSGLKAASDLAAKYGPRSVAILEAQDRIGGRVKAASTSKIGASYDLGAAWFHDALTNCVLHECLADGSFSPSEGYFDDGPMGFYSESGLIDLYDLKIETLVADFEQWLDVKYSDLDVKDKPLTEALREYTQRYSALLRDAEADVVRRAARYLELWYGISQWDISAKYASMSHQGRNFYNKRGYSFLVEKLRKELKDVEIRLNVQVARIERDIKGPKRHRIRTKDGGEILANYVVVTIPQSVLALKEGPHAVEWKPPLPQTMLDALDSISFGSLGKVIFEFDSVWWDKKTDRFVVLPKSDATLKVEPFNYPCFAINYATVAQKPALVLLTQSPVTDYVEASPEKAWELFKPMLQQLGNIRAPINTIVTDWTQNPYSRGSYSAVKVGDEPVDMVVQFSGEYEGCGLASLTIRFAGEHTVDEGGGCVHGAYASGRRAAKWIIEHKLQ